MVTDMINNIPDIAQGLTPAERHALRTLPAWDRGHLSDEQWWCYYALLDAGLLTSAPGSMMVPTPLGQDVLRRLDQS